MNLKRGYNRKGTGQKRLFKAFEHLDYRENVGNNTLKKSQLSNNELSLIIEAVTRDKLSHSEAGVKFGVSARLV